MNSRESTMLGRYGKTTFLKHRNNRSRLFQRIFPRKGCLMFSLQERRALLPIKSKEGIILQSMDVEEEQAVPEETKGTAEQVSSDSPTFHLKVTGCPFLCL